jgi:hypothetical protein
MERAKSEGGDKVNGDGEDGGQERLRVRVFRAHSKVFVNEFIRMLRDSTHEPFSTETYRSFPAIFDFEISPSLLYH